MNWIPTTFHQHKTHAPNQFKLPIDTPTFQLTPSDYVFTQSSLQRSTSTELYVCPSIASTSTHFTQSGLQRPTSTELYVCPSVASTSTHFTQSGLQRPTSTELYVCPSIASTSTHVPRQMVLCREFRNGTTDGLSVMKMCFRTFLPLSSLARNYMYTSTCFFYTQKNLSNRITPKTLNIQTQGVTIKERKRKLLVKD